jgi:hypothetical protein
MIIDKILASEREYRERYRGAPTILTLNLDLYNQLLEEWEVEEIEVFHGMIVKINSNAEEIILS